MSNHEERQIEAAFLTLASAVKRCSQILNSAVIRVDKILKVDNEDSSDDTMGGVCGSDNVDTDPSTIGSG